MRKTVFISILLCLFSFSKVYGKQKINFSLQGGIDSKGPHDEYIVK